MFAGYNLINWPTHGDDTVLKEKCMCCSRWNLFNMVGDNYRGWSSCVAGEMGKSAKKIFSAANI
jgi:hypothetical protein